MKGTAAKQMTGTGAAMPVRV